MFRWLLKPRFYSKWYKANLDSATLLNPLCFLFETCFFFFNFVLYFTSEKKKSLSYVKFMKTRLEIIQKKKKAEQKFMKSDIAELLRSGLDYDAYIRVR